ncbi:MAG: methyltransferase domain-containing protein [Pseudomonadota bacterium]
MSKDQDSPIALNAYEALAEGYAAIAEQKAENGYNEHPAMRAQLGDVRGLSVLDAGCGPGFLTRDLLSLGAASVVALDVSPTMIRLAEERNGPTVEYHVADLAQPIEQGDASFDLVVSSLALDYVRDWSRPLGEFYRLLKPAGRLLFSVQHPMGAYQWFKPPSAFGVHYCEATWRGFTEQPVVVPDYYRSFEELINPLLDAGFRLTHLHETKPLAELADIDPGKYQKNATFPTFIIVDASRN